MPGPRPAASIARPAGAGSAKWGYFKTPSGNIQCDFYVGDYVRCGIRSGLKPAPPKRGPHCFVPNRVALGLTGRAVLAGPSSCPGEDEGDAGPFAGGQGGPPVPVLAYGKPWRGGGLSRRKLARCPRLGSPTPAQVVHLSRTAGSS